MTNKISFNIPSHLKALMLNMMAKKGIPNISTFLRQAIDAYISKED